MLSQQAWALPVKQAHRGASFTGLQGEFPVQNGAVVPPGIVQGQSVVFDVFALHRSNRSGGALDGHCSVGY